MVPLILPSSILALIIFFPMMPVKDKSVYHTNPEEALQVAQDLKSKKIIGMHWGTVVLSLEPIMEPRERFKN